MKANFSGRENGIDQAEKPRGEWGGDDLVFSCSFAAHCCAFTAKTLPSQNHQLRRLHTVVRQGKVA